MRRVTRQGPWALHGIREARAIANNHAPSCPADPRFLHLQSSPLRKREDGLSTDYTDCTDLYERQDEGSSQFVSCPQTCFRRDHFNRATPAANRNVFSFLHSIC